MLRVSIVIQMNHLGTAPELNYQRIRHLTIFLNVRHAGVYTPEEVVLVTRDKLIKLQALYLDQFKRLHHQLKCARRRYLNGVKKEKENGGITFCRALPRIS